jgi:hypothetical protein
MSSLAAQRLKFQLVFSCVVIAVGLVVTWLLLADSSPFHDYFMRDSGLADVWYVTAIVPYIVSAMIEGNPHSPSMVIFILVLVLQWIVLAWVLSIPVARLWISFHKK